jgi:hypothetical protein
MSTIDWKLVWKNALKSKELFPIKALSKNTLSISCPTRFSNVGRLSIDVTPSFNDNSIVLELLVFNDNVIIDDIPKKNRSKSADVDKDNEFNKLANQLVQYELSNRIMERFKIKSDGFSSNEDAELALIDYINNKATESGRMFDDKLDELNDSLNKKESYAHIVESIRSNRRFILKKVESILNGHYGWRAAKNEDFGDSTASFVDSNGKLAAVVSLADNFLIVNLSKDIAAKVSILQSDEDIESELTDDIENAQSVLADREDVESKEIDQIKDAIENSDEVEEEDDYLESLSRRLTKLESLYIRRKLHRV